MIDHGNSHKRGCAKNHICRAYLHNNNNNNNKDENSNININTY